MTDAFMSDPDVIEKYGLAAGESFGDRFSAVSIENILFYVVAVANRLTVQLFERHKTEVERLLEERTPGTAGRYAYTAKLFQYGMSLVPETDRYDNTGLTDEQISAMRVVKYAAATEAKDKSVLYLKIAGGGDVRRPLPDAQLTAFRKYINDVQYAGVRISVVNDPADEMKLRIDVYYDALVLDETGKRLDGESDTPVQNAVRSYLNNLPFNGTYSNQALTDTLQQVHGVVVAEIREASSRYAPFTEFTAINARETAHAGYYGISDEDLILNFIPDEEIF